MFGRYPDRRLTLRDVMRVRVQRALLLVPVILALEMGGVLPDLREFVRTRGPEVVEGLDTLAARPAPPPQDCSRVLRGEGLVFHRATDC